MRIQVNENPTDVPDGTTLFGLSQKIKSNADVIILNGAIMREDSPLREGDAVVFIQRGETPSRDELESLMTARHTPGVHAKINQATVGIAGLGGLGSAVAIALARIGIGKLILADFDVVEPSNLNRQQFFVDQIGQTKVEALTENLNRINPYVRIEGHKVVLTRENIPAIFGKVEVMVEAFDVPENKAMIVDSFGANLPNTPLVVATGLAGHHPSNSIQTRRMGQNLIIVGDNETAAQPGTGLMAPRVGIAAHHQANAVLRILLGEEPAT